MRPLERLALAFTTTVATFLIVATPWGLGRDVPPGGNWHCLSKRDKVPTPACPDCSNGQFECRKEAMPLPEFSIGECAETQGTLNIRCEMYLLATCGDEHDCDSGDYIEPCAAKQSFVRIYPGSPCPKTPTDP